MTQEQTTKTGEVLAAFPDLRYEAEFVPWSKSRNAAEKQPSLNWIVTIRCGGATIRTDYMQGIGHLPGYTQGRKSVDYDAYEKNAAESGKYNPHDPLSQSTFSKQPLPAPPLADVLYSLLSDGDAIDYPTYEEWSGEFGYDDDSRKGETVYRACLETGLKMRRMFGDDGLSKLRELFQDY